MQGDLILFRPIGVIRSEHDSAPRTPIQPVYATGCTGRAEIFPEFEEGLRDLEGFSHLYLIYFSGAGPARLVVKPFLQDADRGVFATGRPAGQPHRPERGGTGPAGRPRASTSTAWTSWTARPCWTSKPYTRRFDRIETTRNGWQDEVDEDTAVRRGKRMSPQNFPTRDEDR